jgi:hypothetical protein
MCWLLHGWLGCNSYCLRIFGQEFDPRLLHGRAYSNAIDVFSAGSSIFLPLSFPASHVPPARALNPRCCVVWQP